MRIKVGLVVINKNIRRKPSSHSKSNNSKSMFRKINQRSKNNNNKTRMIVVNSNTDKFIIRSRINRRRSKLNNMRRKIKTFSNNHKQKTGETNKLVQLKQHQPNLNLKALKLERYKSLFLRKSSKTYNSKLQLPYLPRLQSLNLKLPLFSIKTLLQQIPILNWVHPLLSSSRKRNPQ